MQKVTVTVVKVMLTWFHSRPVEGQNTTYTDRFIFQVSAILIEALRSDVFRSGWYCLTAENSTPDEPSDLVSLNWNAWWRRIFFQYLSMMSIPHKDQFVAELCFTRNLIFQCPKSTRSCGQDSPHHTSLIVPRGHGSIHHTHWDDTDNSWFGWLVSGLQRCVYLE